MIPPHIVKWLKSFDHAGYTQAILESQAEITDALASVSLSPHSEIGGFYLKYGALSAPGWYEILEVTDLLDMADYIHEEFDLPDHFIALTSHEGGGFSLMDRESSAIYDITYDQIDDMLAGDITPVAKSFSGYLEWRKLKHDEMQ